MIHLVTLNPALDLVLRVEDPRSGKIGEVLDVQIQAGGKALNVARFLKKWGIRPATWLGTDGESDSSHVLYRALLREEGLAVNFLGGSAPVRFNVMIQNKKKSMKYNHPGFELDLASFPRLYKAVKKGDLLVMTGRLPMGMNPGLYGAWIRAFGRKNVGTVIDTSGDALREALQAKPWFFKVNLFEFSEAVRQRISNLKQFSRSLPNLLKSGLLHGAVTHGEAGAVLWNGNQSCWVRSSRKVKSTSVVGAGDAFLAGYLKGLQSRMSFGNCAKLACAAGTVVAMTGIRGFDVKLVSKLLKSVKVTKF